MTDADQLGFFDTSADGSKSPGANSMLPEQKSDDAEMHDIIGIGSLSRLTAVWPGRRLYIPAKIDESHPIALTLGIEEAQRISEQLPKETVRLPPQAAILKKKRNEAINQRLDEGAKNYEICAEFGIGERRLQQIREQYLSQTNGPQK